MFHISRFSSQQIISQLSEALTKEFGDGFASYLSRKLFQKYRWNFHGMERNLEWW
jgi:hypothetical protein